jgi:hypothetical protein
MPLNPAAHAAQSLSESLGKLGFTCTALPEEGLDWGESGASGLVQLRLGDFPEAVFAVTLLSFDAASYPHPPDEGLLAGLGKDDAVVRFARTAELECTVVEAYLPNGDAETRAYVQWVAAGRAHRALLMVADTGDSDHFVDEDGDSLVPDWDAVEEALFPAIGAVAPAKWEERD